MVKARGWIPHRVSSDRVSGAKERRPGLDALMRDARRSAFDVVVAWRFARSVKQFPMGKAMFTMIAALAELEGSIIRERVMAGLDHARRNGAKSGKPVGRPLVVFRRDLVATIRQGGRSRKEISE